MLCDTALFAASVFAVLDLALGHVRLTFPPARDYSLDFLDTTRTPEPCGGMKKGLIKTTIPAGQSLKVAWHLGYPHNGGIRLELLDSSERKLQDLTPNGQFAGADDKKMQEFSITLSSDLSCSGCTIRLVRQALEWGPSYQFQSCADVDIVPLSSYQTSCSGRGAASGSSCNCDRLYFGERCQFKNECETDSDCNNMGTCVDIQGTSLPRKQCFCKPGRFSTNCEANSSLSEMSFDPALYAKADTSQVEFYWRMVNEGKEVEGVIVGRNTESYVAVGWRPSSLTKSCQDFPSDATAPKRADAFHSMDCMDIVIGAVHGEDKSTVSRVGDYYTRDRSTPQPDTFYGGVSDLTGAVGWESDGATHIMFRKLASKSNVGSQGNGDHDFAGEMVFIWAHGRFDDPFYAKDELKYHGGNRGHTTLVAPGSAQISSSSSLVLSLFSLILLAYSH
jgi:hypothetical protein